MIWHADRRLLHIPSSLLYIGSRGCSDDLWSNNVAEVIQGATGDETGDSRPIHGSLQKTELVAGPLGCHYAWKDPTSDVSADVSKKRMCFST